MIAVIRGAFEQGQALIEALIALVVLGAVLQAILTIGALSNQEFKAANLSRLFAFNDADEQTQRALKHADNIDVEQVSSDASSTLMKHAMDINPTTAFELEKDWLASDSSVRKVTVTVPSRRNAFARSSWSIVRHTVIARSSGHEQNQTGMFNRLENSAKGWSNVVRQSCTAGQHLLEEMSNENKFSMPTYCTRKDSSIRMEYAP